MMDVQRESGCLSLRFGFDRLVSDPDVPHRVVRIPHFGPGSGRRTRVDPRAVLGDRPRGRGASKRVSGIRLLEGLPSVRKFLLEGLRCVRAPASTLIGARKRDVGGYLHFRCPWAARWH